MIASTTGSQTIAAVGAIPYTAIIPASSTSADAKAIASVTTPESGIMARSKPVLRTIEWRSWTDPSPLTTLAITSWKGTVAHAMLSPGAVPGRSITKVTRTR